MPSQLLLMLASSGVFSINPTQQTAVSTRETTTDKPQNVLYGRQVSVNWVTWCEARRLAVHSLEARIANHSVAPARTIHGTRRIKRTSFCLR